MGEAKTPYIDLTTQDQVEDIMSEDAGPAVIDFWSPTCGPCMAMADDFAAVAGQFDPDEVGFYKVNTGEHGHLAAPFNIMSVPTILFVHRGEVLDSVIGRMSARDLGKRSEWLLKRASKKGLLGGLFGG